MNWLITALVTGATSFAATNIDDIFVLMLFFGGKEKAVRGWHVVLGQYLGFTALVAISMIGFFAQFITPREWIGLFGFLPIAIGIKKLSEWKKTKNDAPGNEAEGISNAASSVFTVAAVTFANGADNIGIYTPLFAASGYKELLTILRCFLSCWPYGAQPDITSTCGRKNPIIPTTSRLGNFCNRTS
jgi:cadmium resistance protein CadD (predicted permease)